MEKLRPAKVHELSAQAAMGPWTQQHYTPPYQQMACFNPYPQNEIHEATFNSLNNPEDNRHILLLWMSTQLSAKIHYFDSMAGC